MHENILNFSKQFQYEPEVEGFLDLKGIEQFILIGMGGSHLAGDILKSHDPLIRLIVRSGYGLPKNYSDNFISKSLIILSSHSGNTIEVLDTFSECLKKKIKMVVITSGGKLLEMAKEKNIVHVEIPDKRIIPRMALGYYCMALSSIGRRSDLVKELMALSGSLIPQDYEVKGRELAKKIGDKIPIIYSSDRNYSIAYNWKIRFNENSKVPAFYNLIPESNHNELEGFLGGKSKENDFIFFLIKDEGDDPRVKKRINVLSELLRNKYEVATIDIGSRGRFHQIFSTLLLGDWISLYLAEMNGMDPSKTNAIEKFKSLL